jgi:hypothetical protein
MRGGLLLGGLAGLASLARLDSLLAAGLVGIFLLWREGRAWRLPRGSLSYGLATGLILLPYFARNLLVFGHLTPSSGRALAYMHSYAESFAFTSGLQLIAYQPAIDLTWAPAWLLFAGGIVLVGMVWSLASAQRALLAPLLLYAVVLTFYYAYLQQQGRPRYYVAVGVVVVLVLCAWLSDWWRKQENKPASPLAAARINLLGKSGQEPQILRITQRDAVVETLHATSLPLKPPLPTTESRIARGATLLVAVFAISLNTVLFVRHIRELQQAPYLAQPAMYQAARWIAHNLPPDARLAAQNSGVFQYYSERVVINIDGKLNHEIIPVLEQRAILDYLHAKGVRYIVDLEGVADYITFYSSRLSDAPAHQELSSLDKMVIYARLIAAKVGMAPPVELDERRPTRIIHPFDEIVQVVKTFPLPNNPDEAVMIYHLEDVESGERKAESGERIADTHHSSLITRHWYDG